VGAAADAQTVGASMSAYVQAVRELSRRARPRPTDVQRAERWSPDLAAAIASHSAAPTVENEVSLAQAFIRLGIADQAYEHFAKAARLDPGEGAAWDGLARIWRDWGFPHIGLGDAYRAVYAAPMSPAVHNTLGTILQSLGKGREARARFVRVLALDADAAYAQNNLCYSWLMEANADAASVECSRALAIEPGLIPARNNLALARAIAGDLAGAAEIFGAAGGEAAAQYNLGIVCLAQRRYPAAADAFDRAAALQPSLVLARARARQARRHAADAVEDGGFYERR
jgi:Flp pilus assembly protein TadD